MGEGFNDEGRALPCPFCCEHAWVGVRRFDGKHSVHCYRCKAEGPAGMAETPAIDAWNRRPGVAKGES